jgi:hypothetical protein
MQGLFAGRPDRIPQSRAGAGNFVRYEAPGAVRGALKQLTDSP